MKVCLWSFKNVHSPITNKNIRGMWRIKAMEKWNLSLASQIGGIQTLERMNQMQQFYHGSPRFAECTDLISFLARRRPEEWVKCWELSRKTCCQSWMSYMWFCNKYDYITAIFFPLYVTAQWCLTLWQYDNIDWHVVNRSMSSYSPWLLDGWALAGWVSISPPTTVTAATAPQKITYYMSLQSEL